MSWLFEVERNESKRVLSVTCLESESNDVAEQADVPPWVRLVFDEPALFGDSIYYSLPQSKFFTMSTQPRTDNFIKYRVPVNGVALCDNPGSGKTIVSLALIHSRPFVSVGNLGFDVTSFIPSRATLIICPLHLATQWQAEAIRCIPNVRVVIINV